VLKWQRLQLVDLKKTAVTTKLRSHKTVPGTRLWNRVANFRTGSYVKSLVLTPMFDIYVLILYIKVQFSSPFWYQPIHVVPKY